MACKRTVRIMMKRFTKKKKRKPKFVVKSIQIIHQPSKEKIGLHHLPIGEVGPSIKCSHLSLSRCSTGSLGTCTHIILRSKLVPCPFPLPKPINVLINLG